VGRRIPIAVHQVSGDDLLCDCMSHG
jgi:hypothetical protein